MKKKMLTALTALMLIAVAVFGFTGCGEEKETPPLNDEKEISSLKIETKYVYERCINNKSGASRYYIFSSDGTGKYFNEWDDEANSSCTITFNYTYMDSSKEAIICFFDSVEYTGDYDKNSYYIIKSDWKSELTVSENIITSVDAANYVFVNENYAKKLTNFRKSSDE